MIDIQRVEIEKILAFINEKPVETFDNKPGQSLVLLVIFPFVTNKTKHF